MISLSPKARALILSFESLNQPSQWPGGSSGITLGYGYDLGYCTSQEFLRDWSPHLPSSSISRLSPCVGLKGSQARAASSSLKDIRITHDQAERVFEERLLPKFLSMTERAFPGIDSLPPDAQGALISLVFNRGGSLEGEKRTEMRTIRHVTGLLSVLSTVCSFVEPHTLRDHIDDDQWRTGLVYCLHAVADQIRLMKRLWMGKGLDGLLKRREAEAQLVESCIVLRTRSVS